MVLAARYALGGCHGRGAVEAELRRVWGCLGRQGEAPHDPSVVGRRDVAQCLVVEVKRSAIGSSEEGHRCGEKQNKVRCF